jgi:hypothetical protein
LARPRSCWR